jgi:glycosyltransferase involved in cell wall biosynthesis
MGNRFLLISEALSGPFDEGVKNIALSLHKQLEIKTHLLTITDAGNSTENLKVNKVRLNKMFLNKELWKLIKGYLPDVILYFSGSSCSFYSFVRAKVLKVMSKGSKVVLFGVQPREYLPIQYSLIVQYMKPDLLLLLGKHNRDMFLKKGLNVKVLPPAVDTTKFCQASGEEKDQIRAKYNIPNMKTIVLHVGHIRKTRNLECFLDIQKIKNVQGVIVSSTSTEQDNDLKDLLIKGGVKIIDEYIPDIPGIFKMSDMYVFPVHQNCAAIEMPLSVLEAMSCNLPVITTRFGGLVNFFEEDAGFKYFNTADELVHLIKLNMNMNRSRIGNTEKMERFTWERFTEEIVTECEKLL